MFSQYDVQKGKQQSGICEIIVEGFKNNSVSRLKEISERKLFKRQISKKLQL